MASILSDECTARNLRQPLGLNLIIDIQPGFHSSRRNNASIALQYSPFINGFLVDFYSIDLLCN